MLPEHRVRLEDEPCPVSDQMLGELYRASAHGLSELIATVPPSARALLAVYCYRRAHLASIGLAIAATCDKDDLTWLGGNAGAALFERSREAPQSYPDVRANGRRKITLATAPLRQVKRHRRTMRRPCLRLLAVQESADEPWRWLAAQRQDQPRPLSQILHLNAGGACPGSTITEVSSPQRPHCRTSLVGSFTMGLVAAATA